MSYLNHGKRQQPGFTLVELMVVLALMAILAALVVPSFNDMTLSSKLRTQVNDLAAGVALARSEAIKRNQQVSLCASSNGTSCTGTWGQGWIVISGATVILRHGPAASGFLINAGTTSFTFQPSGFGVTPTPASPTFVICRATPSVGGQERQVTISTTGRTTIGRTNLGACVASVP